MNLKHIYNIMTKRIWNTKIYDYSYNLEKALINTQRLGLKIDCLDFQSFIFDLVGRENIINTLLYQIYNIDNLRLEDVALKCNIMSKLCQSYLKKTFNINSIITIGNVYVNKSHYYYEPLSILKIRIYNTDINTPFNSHVWLTLENKDILDITFPPNEAFRQIQSGEILNRNDWGKLVWTPTHTIDKRGIVYQPLLLGYEYFEKVNLVPRIHLFSY